jgi:hypothetical protein
MVVAAIIPKIGNSRFGLSCNTLLEVGHFLKSGNGRALRNFTWSTRLLYCGLKNKRSRDVLRELSCCKRIWSLCTLFWTLFDWENLLFLSFLHCFVGWLHSRKFDCFWTVKMSIIWLIYFRVCDSRNILI